MTEKEKIVADEVTETVYKLLALNSALEVIQGYSTGQGSVEDVIADISNVLDLVKEKIDLYTDQILDSMILLRADDPEEHR